MLMIINEGSSNNQFLLYEHEMKIAVRQAIESYLASVKSVNKKTIEEAGIAGAFDSVDEIFASDAFNKSFTSLMKNMDIIT